MKHRWKKLSGKPVKGEIERKQCKRCGMQVRNIRKGGSEPRSGWIETWYRPGKSGMWQTPTYGTDHKIPQCGTRITCPRCNGTGTVSGLRHV